MPHITQELKDMVMEWIETGVWEPLHDALLEHGMVKHANHLTQNCSYTRDGCLITNVTKNPELALGWEGEE